LFIWLSSRITCNWLVSTVLFIIPQILYFGESVVTFGIGNFLKVNLSIVTSTQRIVIELLSFTIFMSYIRREQK